jgi:hypothetical protein
VTSRKFRIVTGARSAARAESGDLPRSNEEISVNAINPAPDKVQLKLAVIRLAEELGNVVLACRTMGFSRGSFYRARARYLAGGEAAVVDRARRPPEPTNRLAPAVEDEVVELSLAHPRWGRRRLVQALRQRGTSVSPSGVRCVWKRRGLLTENDRLARAGMITPAAP